MSKTYTIEKGYRIPPAGEKGRFKPSPCRNTPRRNTPISALKVDESFVIPCTFASEAELVQRSVSAKVCNYVREYEPKRGFVTRQVKSGVRVWRIK